MEKALPQVTVVIATKDRPDSLARLLESVKHQTFSDFEVIVIDDGSSRDVHDRYPSLWADLDKRFRLERNESNHGPGGSRNAGIRLAQGEFVAFCDDDDIWVRDDHLESAVLALNKFDGDVYLANMRIAFNGTIIDEDWYGKGGQLLKGAPLDLTRTLFEVKKADVARFLEHRLLHANTLVVRRALLNEIGLYWDKIYVGEDLDFSLRLVDSSHRILYCPNVAAEGDASPRVTVTRRHVHEENILFRMVAALHAESRLRHRRFRRTARSIRASSMAELSKLSVANGQRRWAIRSILESLMICPRVSAAWQLGKLLLTALRPSKKERPPACASRPPSD